MLQFHNISDAGSWLNKQCLSGNSYPQYVQRGSIEKCDYTYRQQFLPIAFRILNPLNFSYLPNTVTVSMIEDYYLNYIIDPTERAGEDYSYGTRIDWSLEIIMNMLKETPRTNQAIISVYAPDDEVIEYPPCLLFIQFLFFYDKLHIVTNWRSNDISEAFLLNQGGMSLLLRDVAEYAELPVGTSFYFCSAPHVYLFRMEDRMLPGNG